MGRFRGHYMTIQVRSKLREHPVVDAFVERYGVDRDHAHEVVSDAVLDVMDLLGTAYVAKMTRTITRMTELREAIHFVYEKVLTGHPGDADVMALRQKFEELHATTAELVDPKAWVEKEGAAMEPLPRKAVEDAPALGAEPRPAAATGAEVAAGSGQPRAKAGQAAPATRRTPEYAGRRTEVPDRPTRAPRNGDPVEGGGTWREEVKRSGDITLELDADGLYWKFPDLPDGTVLHFPEYGYRVWKDPIDGAIVEELVAGPSVTKARRYTRGEDVLFSAAEVSEAYKVGRVERAHGAGSPGLGFDAPYGVAHAVQRINQWLENRGVEQWVRNLRDNAAPGIEYIWTTRTKKSGQALANREYTISALVDGKIHELYVFEATVPPGSPVSDLSVQFELLGVSPAAAVYGAPRTKASRAAMEAGEGKTAIERVTPPEVITEALGRRLRETPEVSHPAVQKTGERLADLTAMVNTRLLEHAARPEPQPLPPHGMRRPDAGAADLAMIDAIDQLTTVVEALHREITTTAPDLDRLARIDVVVTAFRRSAGARRVDRVTAADVRRLRRQLQALLEEGS